MPARMSRTITIAVVAIGFCGGAVAADGVRPRHATAPHHGSGLSRSQDTLKTPYTRWKQEAVRALPADRDPYADPAAPYKADRLSSRGSQPILDIPGQVTVLTREILDDKNATSLRDALSTTAGVTVGR
jgi:outer membrane receptor protein involved in Fe transport